MENEEEIEKQLKRGQPHGDFAKAVALSGYEESRRRMKKSWILRLSLAISTILCVAFCSGWIGYRWQSNDPKAHGWLVGSPIASYFSGKVTSYYPYPIEYLQDETTLYGAFYAGKKDEAHYCLALALDLQKASGVSLKGTNPVFQWDSTEVYSSMNFQETTVSFDCELTLASGQAKALKNLTIEMAPFLA